MIIEYKSDYQDDFMTVIPRCKPSVGKGDLTKYV